TSSCRHGTSRYEYRHASESQIPARRPLARYAEAGTLSRVSDRYVHAPSATSGVDRRLPMHPRAGLLLATVAHATYHLSTSVPVLVMAPADSHDPGSPEWLHAYYETGYDRYHDGLKVREWHGNAAQDDLQLNDPTRPQSQSNVLLQVADLTSTLLQF